MHGVVQAIEAVDEAGDSAVPRSGCWSFINQCNLNKYEGKASARIQL